MNCYLNPHRLSPQPFKIKLPLHKDSKIVNFYNTLHMERDPYSKTKKQESKEIYIKGLRWCSSTTSSVCVYVPVSSLDLHV